MTRPDSVNGPFGSPTQQWGWPAPYAGQQFPGQAQAPQQTADLPAVLSAGLPAFL